MLSDGTEGFALSSKPHLFLHKFSIWPPQYCVDWWNRGFHTELWVPTSFLTSFTSVSMWYCVDCWQGVKHQVTYLLTVLTGGAEDSTLSSKPPPPPPPFSSQAFHLTAMWCCVDWCCWSEGGRLQLNTHAPCLCGFEWSDTVDRLWGAWWYGVRRSCAETAAVTCGTSYARTNSKVCTPFQWLVKRRAVKGYSHWFRTQCSGAVWKSRLPSRAPVPGSRP